MTRVSVSICLILLLHPQPVTAELSQFEIQSIQGALGTDSVVFEATTSRGKVLGCTLIYRAPALDHVYKGGQPISIVGNIAISSVNGAMVPSLKIVLNDFVTVLPSVVTGPDTPEFAYLESVDGQNIAQSVIDQTESDTPGSLFVVLKTDDQFLRLFESMMLSEKVFVVFNRRGGQLDMKVPLDLTVVESRYDTSSQKNARRRDSSETRKFANCVGQFNK